MFPAFACALSGRVIHLAPHVRASSASSGRRPSSSRYVTCGYRIAAHPASVASRISAGSS
ncbi:MAG: hypothetical protein M0Z33_08515 [Actinomycetota bacterium]|nr:hypothetical protein [Actinomycetota bacterium]